MTGSGVSGSRSDGRSKALWWAGIGIGVIGVAALVAVAVADLGKADQIASVAGAVLAAAGLGLSLWSLRGGGSGGAAATGVTAAGERSVAAGGNIGAVATGDGATAGPAPTPPASGGTPAPGNPVAGPVTASGDRSVAAGGDIGSVSTGDA
ncbi:hypothetical protein KV205_16895 [Streptomyces sp. SKN60]|uniref:hypothetical protein n=1 Tax=Streptomyces sp. SKN60 TaxID=2855506 RepID=UPI002246EC99|nr:hypothetical protein [Streptomyces sp. SKN60]MCX2182195.1 hypothetical protein [Streptomyces sp. SKN60]